VEILRIFNYLSDGNGGAQAGNKELLTMYVGKFFPVERTAVRLNEKAALKNP
jgi:hypothetical protein